LLGDVCPDGFGYTFLLQFRRKQKLAEQLKEQQRDLAEKQKQREEQLKSLKSEVPHALPSRCPYALLLPPAQKKLKRFKRENSRR
jgi:hypothetical protein